MYIIHQENYKNKTIKIVPDEYADNPRNWDNQTNMACFHKNYILGDKHLADTYKDFENLIFRLWLEHATESEFKNKILKDLKNSRLSIYREILSSGDTWEARFDYMYSYEFCITGDESKNLELPSKITWNFLYLYDHSGITISMNPFSCRFDSGIVGIIYMIDADKNPISYEQQIKIMKSEVKTYDDYIRGNCYGYIIEDSEENEIDSCYGFLGDYEYCLSEAKDYLNSIIE